MQGARIMNDTDFQEMLKHLGDTPKNIIRQLESSNDGKKALYESHFNNVEQVFCGMGKSAIASILDVLDTCRKRETSLPEAVAEEMFTDLLNSMRILELAFQGAVYAHKITAPIQMSKQLAKDTAKRMKGDFHQLVDDIAYTAIKGLENERQNVFEAFFTVKRGRFHVNFDKIKENEVTVTAIVILGLREDQEKIEQYLNAPYDLQNESAVTTKKFGE